MDAKEMEREVREQCRKGYFQQSEPLARALLAVLEIEAVKPNTALMFREAAIVVMYKALFGSKDDPPS